MLSSFFSAVAEAVLPTAYAEEEPKDVNQVASEAQNDNESKSSETTGDDNEESEAPAAEDADEEEEEEEPEDTAPGIREECEQKKCHSVKHHYEECAARVASGKVLIENEDCVEELFHLMHCVDECAAPKVFATLK